MQTVARVEVWRSQRKRIEGFVPDCSPKRALIVGQDRLHRALHHAVCHTGTLLIVRTRPFALLTRSRIRRRFSMASRVKWPCLTALRLFLGAPEPGAPPCIRHRRLPCTAGDLQGLPERVLAPQRGLDNILVVLRRWFRIMCQTLAIAEPAQPSVL
jgi:hypothetical protein